MEIDCNGTVNEYVAAQGPLSDTCADFWQVRLVYFTMLLHIYIHIHLFLIGCLKFQCSNGARKTANQKRNYIKSML